MAPLRVTPSHQEVPAPAKPSAEPPANGDAGLMGQLDEAAKRRDQRSRSTKTAPPIDLVERLSGLLAAAIVADIRNRRASSEQRAREESRA